jgi:hypothetical protein
MAITCVTNVKHLCAFKAKRIHPIAADSAKMSDLDLSISSFSLHRKKSSWLHDCPLFEFHAAPRSCFIQCAWLSLRCGGLLDHADYFVLLGVIDAEELASS